MSAGVAPAAPNIAATLTAMARERPDAVAVIAPSGLGFTGPTNYDRATFAELDRLSDDLAAGLVDRGIGPGVRAALMVRPGIEFFAITFALFKAGAVPVLVDPGLGLRNIGHCLAEAEPAGFIGIEVAQLARRIFGWGRASIRRVVTVGRRSYRCWGAELSRPRGATFPGPHEPADSGETAAILFTSGSTGPPKGVVYTHAMFGAQVELLRSTYGIEPGEVDLCTFPLFALFAPALGLTSVVPEMDFTRPGRVDPAKILGPIAEFGVNNLFGSPSLIRRVGDHAAAEGIKLPTLRRAISAGAPVPARVLATFAGTLGPGAEVFTPYGATECLPVATIGSAEILAETRHRTEQGGGVCVGRPVAGMRARIIPIVDGPIASWSDDLAMPPGAIGEIAATGPVASRAYFRRDVATAAAKIADPSVPAGFWHRMGDVGYLDDRGRIWFCGRKSHRVVTAGGTLFTIPVEGIFNAHPLVARTALVGVGPVGAARPILCVEPRARLGRSDWRRLEAELRTHGRSNPISAPVETFLLHRSFPVDIRHNAKIFREKLAVWAARKLR